MARGFVIVGLEEVGIEVGGRILERGGVGERGGGRGGHGGAGLQDLVLGGGLLKL